MLGEWKCNVMSRKSSSFSHMDIQHNLSTGRFSDFHQNGSVKRCIFNKTSVNCNLKLYFFKRKTKQDASVWMPIPAEEARFGRMEEFPGAPSPRGGAAGQRPQTSGRPLSLVPSDAQVTLTKTIFVHILYEEKKTLILNLLKILYDQCF